MPYTYLLEGTEVVQLVNWLSEPSVPLLPTEQVDDMYLEDGTLVVQKLKPVSEPTTVDDPLTLKELTYFP